MLRKGKKESKFDSEGQPKDIDEKGITAESRNSCYNLILAFIVIILGFILTLLDIKDEGMTIDIDKFHYCGTIVGVVIIIIGVLYAWRNGKNDIRLKK